MQDARDALGALRVPTLVMHRRDDAFIRVEAGRYLADHIDGAKYVELPGIDNALWAGDYDAVLDEVEEFLTGSRQAPEGDVVGATRAVHRHRRVDRTVGPPGSSQVDRADGRARRDGAREPRPLSRY